MSRTESENPYAAPSAEQRDTTVPRLAVRTLIAKVTLAGALAAAGAGWLIGLVGVIGGRREDAFTSPEPSVYVVGFYLAVLARALTIPVCGIALLAWLHRAVRRREHQWLGGL